MIVRSIYKVFRSILFSVALVVAGLYVLLYTLVFIPAFTNMVKDKACEELSSFLGGEVLIEELQVYPFNEVQIKGLEVYDPLGEECLKIETIGAGIRLWKLLLEGKIEFTYGEIIGLNANIVQKEKDSPLNIDFIIKAFASKDEKKEKSPFELALHNVVLRKSQASFRREWLNNKKIGNINLADLEITNLAADITFPKISNRGIIVDLRRLSFILTGAMEIETLKFKGDFNKEYLNLEDFTLLLPSSKLYIPNINLKLDDNENVVTAISEGKHQFQIIESYLTPSDFSSLIPQLETFTEPLDLSVKISGNLRDFDLEKFYLGNSDLFTLDFIGGFENISDIKNSTGNVSDFNLFVSNSLLGRMESSIKNLSSLAQNALKNLGDVNITGNFSGAMLNNSLKGNLQVISDAFTLNAEGGIQKNNLSEYSGEGEINIEQLKLHELIPKIPVNDIDVNIVAEGSYKEQNWQGMLSLVVDNFDFKGTNYDGFSLNIAKNEEIIDGDLLINNAIADISAKFNGDIDGKEKSANLNMEVNRLNLSKVTDLRQYEDYIISGEINTKVYGSNINDIAGELSLQNFSFKAPDNSRKLNLKQLKITAGETDSLHSINIASDWLNASFEGELNPKALKNQIIKMTSSVFPALIPPSEYHVNQFHANTDFDIVIRNNNSIPEFFNLPFRFLVPVSITGNLDSGNNSASLIIDVPYLQQGKDKLIYDSGVKLNIYGDEGIFDASIQTTMPVKKGDLALDISLYGQNNSLETDIHWVNTENSDFKGHLLLNTLVSKPDLHLQPLFTVNIRPSVLQMGTADWNVSAATLTYSDKNINIDNLKIWNDTQFVEIFGKASPNYEDVLKVTLADIDVDYVFNMLQINYVTFGGSATGEIAGHSLLSSDPVAETEYFRIHDLSYNGAVLGDAIVTSKWNNEAKEIEITADISHNGKRRVLGSGGIWIGKDSLNFNINADKVPVDFIQPFMSVFSSHVGGYATGDVKLFGNFHDIDMTGKIYADSVAVKLDYTNTIYHGSDSVYLNPGQIEIPHFTLYDRFGNSALLTGELTHHFFHDPSFTFRLSDANNFLCYDTNSDINPDWYGTLYGNGSALLRGVPGLVDISADMTVSGNSSFTFVLNDTQYAQDYQFLTFSDKRGEEKRKENSKLTVDDFKEMLRKKMAENEGSLSKFGIDIRATVTPQALFTLVMDPAAGDKITARGRGAMQVKYESDNDEMMMYGKYEIDEGNYNFSLQDIILRDFKIKEGSYISFNGNPLAADLDISATYRVNTNLSDLDKSFSTDRDLNRTNVPVDAVLSVEGNMQHPDITFDIELPTLTQDVERKVKSIISTDDMMNRQIIYLLALNRFYTPEYMGSSGNGGELAAVASSTISSQLSNILGQLTDKFSVSPSFRSDKGDFSDIEVDVALSSRLLNNRLLINGNFGYRDRSNSSTTFVGDFDVEYLLSKNGNLRLKAYNHFNDQNYYLREALTTQGLGVVYRKDFDDWFTFLKKKSKAKKQEPDKVEEENNKEEAKSSTEIGTNGAEN